MGFRSCVRRRVRVLCPLVLVLVVGVALAPVGAAGAVSGDPEIERLEGPDRYATSLAVARRFAREAGGALDSAVLVSGTSWPDAVAAAGLAGSLDAPVLLAGADGLSADALGFLADARVSSVVAVATGAAGAAALLEVLGSLPSGVTDTELVSGSDASVMSAEVAERIGDPGVMPGHGRTVIVANSTVFADALVAGPFAARGAHPVLLTPRGALHSDVAAYITARNVDHVVIMGGTAAISAGVERGVSDPLCKGVGLRVSCR
ncbi:cell wall-binding repeat-containing protein [Candidatus Poriferisodalis sp.]|uniref:cell wall-binding repeat-containing protein n=1 Tax=Candidatus Poriferisodalis sp. TaxID=3101277 RepID=UPI003B51B0F2